MAEIESWEIWKEGCIKEVARVYAEIGNLSNVTYETEPDFVAFFTDGFLLAMHYRNNLKNTPKWGKEALLNEISFHTNLLRELEGN